MKVHLVFEHSANLEQHLIEAYSNKASADAHKEAAPIGVFRSVTSMRVRGKYTGEEPRP